MRTHSHKLRGILLLLVTLLSFLPHSTVKAAEIIDMDTTWSGLVPLTEDVRVINGATLTIEPGTIVRAVSGDNGASGIDSDLIELIVENGFLAVDSAIFEAEVGFKWHGIQIMVDGDAEIINSEIKDSAVYGVWIDSPNEVVLSGNQIHNILGKYGDPHGSDAAGITIQQGSHTILGNQLYDIAGGDGESSIDPAGDGGDGYGIKISGGASMIQLNTISNIKAGKGGSGSQGTPGTDGSVGATPGDPGTEGGAGGDGGDAGNGGTAYGVYAAGAAGVQIVENLISTISGGNSDYPGAGGAGGIGGNGAAGGNTSDPEDMTGGAGGLGGNGGEGGNGGDGGHAYGMVLNSNNILMTDNLLIDIYGGNGCQGSPGGHGGDGGIGGTGANSPGQPLPAGNGGAGGNGGYAGISGETGLGGNGIGIYTYNASFSHFSRNKIANVHAGSVLGTGVSGTGGDGGAGGDGGSGYMTAGFGGAGGKGGGGASGAYGGDPGFARGLWQDSSAKDVLITNSLIAGIHAKDGGIGAVGGPGGAGGDGGDGGVLGLTGMRLFPGNGGDGGAGGAGGDGGNASSAILVRSEGASVTLTNNTLAHPSKGGGGIGGNGGVGGTGGEIGEGTDNPDGSSRDGLDGSDGGDGLLGDDGVGLGVLAVTSATVKIFNSIITGYNSANYTGIFQDPSSSITSDYNDLFDWKILYGVFITPGPNDLSADPLFFNAALSDFHVLPSSPCIDAGWGGAIGLPEDDLDHKPRPLDGDENGTSIVDIGAYEFGGYRLTVNAEHGSVSVTPNHVIYDYNQLVTLTASPDPGWTFTGWSGFVSVTDNPLTINILGNTSLTANFTQNDYTFSVVVSPLGSGTVTIDPLSDTYHYGDEITLTANPNPGWSFSHWDGDASGTDNPLIKTIQGNTNVTAVFIERDYGIYLPLIVR